MRADHNVSNDLDLSNESDDQLLGRMADSDGSRAAWGELHRRHFRFLYSVCYRATLYGDRHGTAFDLAMDTLRRAFEAAGQFALPDETPTEDIPRVVRAWLCRIATNLQRDQIRKEGTHRLINLDQGEWQNIERETGTSSSRSTEEVRRVMSEELDDKERDIIVTTFQWYDPSKTNQRVPNGVLETLAEKWGIKTDTIRQIRKRSLAKLENALRASMASWPVEREYQ